MTAVQLALISMVLSALGLAAWAAARNEPRSDRLWRALAVTNVLLSGCVGFAVSIGNWLAAGLLTVVAVALWVFRWGCLQP